MRKVWAIGPAKRPDGRTVECRVYHNAEWGEYIAKCYMDGKHQEGADYHTEQQDDACATARAMYYGALI